MADPMIVCDGLVKIYKTKTVEVMALQGLDMTVEKGELMAIIGNSGSGKSTFLNMVGGLMKPSAGSLFVDGRDLFAMSEKELVKYKQETVGFVWQKSGKNLFPYLTAVQNVEVPMEFSSEKLSATEKRQRALGLLDMVGMSHRKDSFMHQLSGGEQQRVAIAIALANKPKLLLADEPTGAVDQKTSLMIQDMFRRLNRELDLTVVIVTHDISLAKKVDRVVMIRDGKISSERLMKQDYLERIKNLSSIGELGALTEAAHEEFAILDKAGRVQLTGDILQQAGIEGNRVKINVEDGRIIISQ